MRRGILHASIGQHPPASILLLAPDCEVFAGSHQSRSRLALVGQLPRPDAKCHVASAGYPDLHRPPFEDEIVVPAFFQSRTHGGFVCDGTSGGDVGSIFGKERKPPLQPLCGASGFEIALRLADSLFILLRAVCCQPTANQKAGYRQWGEPSTYHKLPLFNNLMRTDLGTIKR